MSSYLLAETRQPCLTAVAMPAQPNQSLIDGLRVLQTLVSQDRPIGSSDMAAMLGIDVTRASRLLGTLAAVGLARQGKDRKYQPGPGVHILAAQSLQGSHLLASALPHLEVLREEISAPKLRVALGVLWQRHVCYLFHAWPGLTLSQAIGTHELERAGNSSIGALLLSQMNDENEIALAQAELSGLRHPPPLALSEAVAAARRNGYGRIDYASGDVSLAAPVGIPAIAGLAVSGRFDAAQIPDIVERLLRTTGRITEAMTSHP